jgi:serine protease Do
MKYASRTLIAVICLSAGTLGGCLLNERLQLQAQPQVDVKPGSSIPRELTSYRDIVKQVLPAVVSIESRLKAKFNQNGEQPFGFGSGFIVDSKGIILTNYHVIDGAEAIEVRLTDGRRFTPTEIRGDRKTDLAVIKIQPDKPLSVLELGDSDSMEVGDRVLAVGAPYGLTGSVTHGIISAKSRNVRLNQYEDFLQTDAPINPGNSGGPLVSLDGKVIGINSAIKSKSGGSQGIGLAISSKLVKDVMRQLLKQGTVKRGYMGVEIRDIDDQLARQLGVKAGSGVVITRIFEKSPAANSGLKLGDVVHSIAGKPIHDGLELQKVVVALPLRNPVDVVVTREGASAYLKLSIEEQPEEFGLAPIRD